eukprot:m.103060 g.103060  ORF g.103060 m.103060 type:complete len:129 (-) comp9088_c9_seq1:235-621(-)
MQIRNSTTENTTLALQENPWTAVEDPVERCSTIMRTTEKGEVALNSLDLFPITPIIVVRGLHAKAGILELEILMLTKPLHANSWKKEENVEIRHCRIIFMSKTHSTFLGTFFFFLCDTNIVYYSYGYV